MLCSTRDQVDSRYDYLGFRLCFVARKGWRFPADSIPEAYRLYFAVASAARLGALRVGVLRLRVPLATDSGFLPYCF